MREKKVKNETLYANKVIQEGTRKLLSSDKDEGKVKWGGGGGGASKSKMCVFYPCLARFSKVWNQVKTLHQNVYISRYKRPEEQFQFAFIRL